MDELKRQRTLVKRKLTLLFKKLETFEQSTDADAYADANTASADVLLSEGGQHICRLETQDDSIGGTEDEESSTNEFLLPLKLKYKKLCFLFPFPQQKAIPH